MISLNVPIKPNLHSHTNSIQSKPHFLLNFYYVLREKQPTNVIRRAALLVVPMVAPIRSVSDCFHQIAGPEVRELYPPHHSLQVIIIDVCEGLPTRV